MTKIFKINEINSNVIFLFPIISGYVKRDYIYSLLALSIFIASFFFHLCIDKNPESHYIKYLRGFDIGVATVCYLYMFYFVYLFVPYYKSLFYSLLVLTVFIFFFGKKELGKRHNIHSYFHIAIGIVAGIIPLFSAL